MLSFRPASLTVSEQCFVGRFRQSFKYFNHGAGEHALRATLQLRNASLRSRARQLLAPANASSLRQRSSGGSSFGSSSGRRTVVGVHVRSGMGQLGAFSGCLPDAAYYLRALAYYRQRFANVAFVYAAEPAGLAWFRTEVLARDALQGFDCLPLGTGDPVETFAALAHCDASVFSYGSFGWFAAWLAGGSVVYSKHLRSSPKQCDTVARSGAGVDDHIPPQWVAI